MDCVVGIMDDFFYDFFLIIEVLHIEIQKVCNKKIKMTQR